MKKITLMRSALSLFRAVAAPVVAVLALTFLGSASLSAQNGRISVQGTLKTANGASVPDGTQAVTFLLYNVKEGGTALWQEDTVVEVIAGIYSHYLGSVNPLNPAHFASTLYLAVKVGSYELTPRVEFAYSPYAFSVAFAQTVVCSGAVGDIKYSILNPTEFAAENGPCWVPMDGRALAPTDKLRIRTGRTSVPDGGGLFLRSQEFATSPAGNDPGRTSASPIATLQADEFKSHDHDINDPGHSHEYRRPHESRGTDGVQSPKVWINDNNTYDTEPSTTGITIKAEGGAETRPKNLNFWIYIRIN